MLPHAPPCSMLWTKVVTTIGWIGRRASGPDDTGICSQRSSKRILRVGRYMEHCGSTLSWWIKENGLERTR